MIWKPSRKIADLRSIHLPYTLKVYGVTEEQFDELVDEDTKAELFDGVMIVHSPAFLRHDRIGNFLRGLADFYVSEKQLGEILGPDGLIHLATCRRFCPDLFFLRAERVPAQPVEQFEGTPDALMEILSRSNRAEDLDDKRPAYREAGVEEMWFIDPDHRQVIVDRKRRKRYVEEVITKGRVASSVIDGFWVDASWLWADPLPNRIGCLRKILGGK